MTDSYQDKLNQHLFLLIQEHLSSENCILPSGEIEHENNYDFNIYYQFFDFEQDYGLGLSDYGRLKISIQYFERDDDFNLFNDKDIEVLVQVKGSEDDLFHTLFCYNKNSKDEFLKKGVSAFINEEKSSIEKIKILSNLEESVQMQNKMTEIKKRI